VKSRTRSLKELVGEIKAEKKAERSPSETLKKIIDDYSLSGRFDRYVNAHKEELARYISDHESSPTLFRASAAGKCQQYQAFKAVDQPYTDTVNRPGRQMRALYNGTFGHLRWHFMFDALDEAGLVISEAAEESHVHPEISLSGSIDRRITFDYMGVPFKAVIDYKTIASRYWKMLVKPQWDHFMSQHAYDLLGFEGDAFMLLYENKDTQELKIYDNPYDEVTRRRLRTMYANMTKWVAQYKLDEQPRIVLPLIVRWCKWCEFQKACLQEHPDLPEQQKRIGEEEVDEDDGEVDPIW
jgi:hypothetical protein